MLKRAVASFREQTYERKILAMLDTTPNLIRILRPDPHTVSICEESRGRTIGALRNRVCDMASREGADIIAHFDDDDYSHPNRLTEQVALLQASGAECVGYNSMLFWDTRIFRGFGDGCTMKDRPENAAWLYRAVNPKHILGTSLMYWRSTWERQPFDDVATGEDTRFVKKLNVVGVSSVQDPTALQPLKPYIPQGYEPRMVASIHGRNSSGYAPEKDSASSRRVPEWDSFCKSVMQL